MWKHIGGLLLGVLLGAWGAAGASAAQPAGGAPDPALRIALAGPAPTFARHSFAYRERRVLRLLYEPLVCYRDGLKPTACLAQSWRVSRDGRTVTFSLRRGVSFHDGRPLRAADVAANIEQARQAATGGDWALSAPEIRAVTTPDDATVRVEFRYAPYLPLDAFTRLYIASPAGFDKGGVPAGTGPFLLAEQSGGAMVLTRHEGYWKPGLPRLASVHISSYPDGTEALRALEAGRADLADQAPYRQARAEGSGYRMLRGPLESFYVLYLNPQRRPFTRLDARRAVQYAIDRPRLAEEVLGNGR